MSHSYNQSLLMMERVAHALGDELLLRVVFLGGGTTGLLITDDYTRELVRFTDDVDLITHVISIGEWVNFQSLLTQRGFKVSMEDDIQCRMRFEDMIVDFMPDTDEILGFSNRWYPDAIHSAALYNLNDEISINLIHPVYFLATKLEAWKGRGNNDLLNSYDLEDVMNLINGRAEIVGEIAQASADVRGYLLQELSRIQQDRNFMYLLQSTVHGDEERADVILKRLEELKA